MKRAEKVKERYCIGYARVSTEEQARNGVSLDAQRSRIEAWAKAHGLPLAGIYQDAGISGTRTDRPELERAMREACNRKGVLVIYSLSRMGRSTRHLLELAERLKKAGADLVSLSEALDSSTAAGRMTFGLLSVLAQFEAELTAERVTAALHHKMRIGEAPGGTAPYGFKAVLHASKRNKRGGRLLILKPIPHELEAVALARKLRAKGATFAAICERLTEKGYRPRGRCWHPASVLSIVRQQQAAI